MASFRVSGLVPISAAIAGSEVAITVESMFSMNRAVATISGIRRSLFIGKLGRGMERDRRRGCITPSPDRLLRKSSLHQILRDPLHQGGIPMLRMPKGCHSVVHIAICDFLVD